MGVNFKNFVGAGSPVEITLALVPEICFLACDMRPKASSAAGRHPSITKTLSKPETAHEKPLPPRVICDSNLDKSATSQLALETDSSTCEW